MAKIKFKKLNKKEREKYLRINLYVVISMGIILLLGIIGGGLNFFVIKSNGDRMPVLLQSFNFEDETHFSYDNFKKVSYPILTDIIPIGNFIYSLGDILMYLSLGFWVIVVLCYAYNIHKLVKFKKQIIRR